MKNEICNTINNLFQGNLIEKTNNYLSNNLNFYSNHQSSNIFERSKGKNLEQKFINESLSCERDQKIYYPFEDNTSAENTEDKKFKEKFTLKKSKSRKDNFNNSKGSFNKNLMRNLNFFKGTNFSFNIEKYKYHANSQNSTNRNSIDKFITNNNSSQNEFNKKLPDGKIIIDRKLNYDDKKHLQDLKKLFIQLASSNIRKRKHRLFSKSSVNFLKIQKKISNEDKDRISIQKDIISPRTVKSNYIPGTNKTDKINYKINQEDENKKNNTLSNCVDNLIKKHRENGHNNRLVINKIYQSTIDEKVENMKFQFRFKSPSDLKNHIIRDHKIGSNSINNSRFKFESTMKIYNDIEERKKKKIEEELENYYNSPNRKSKITEDKVINNSDAMNIDQEYIECKKDERIKIYVRN